MGPVVRDREPLVPVTVTTEFPALRYVQFKVTEPDVVVELRVTLDELRAQADPPS